MEGIGKKIKNRRIELNMSAEALAEQLNVNPSTIYRYESKGIDNMRIDKVLPIAKALKVSASYLMGWDEDISSSTLPATEDSSVSLSDSKRSLLSYFDELNQEGQDRVLEYASDLVASGRYSKKNNSFELVEEA